jgi:hypothetical protein
VTDPAPLSFFARLVFAWVAYFRVLFDGTFAARVKALADGGVPALPAKEGESRAAASAESAKPAEPERPPVDAALALLALLQREGRLVDFLEQDIASFGDADVGAAARLVHEGCRKALRAHATIEPMRAEEEGARITLSAGYDARTVKLVGAAPGEPPYVGTLRHHGWRVRDLRLPSAAPGHDPTIVAPAEVEL